MMIAIHVTHVDDFTDRWVLSKSKSDYGKFTISAGKFYGDADLDKGRYDDFLPIFKHPITLRFSCLLFRTEDHTRCKVLRHLCLI